MTDPEALDRLLRADRIQHHLVAALALGDHRREPPRLVFKGGTFLRACAMPHYRYSEDLDFDWIGSAGGFFGALADALPAASAASGAFLHLEDTQVCAQPPLLRPASKRSIGYWLQQGVAVGTEL